MNPNRLSSLDDATLRRELARTVADERAATAIVLAHIAEFDARRLYLADACSSMHDYCVQVLHLSDGAAYKRIHAARAAQRFPSLFAHVAAGRLHLSAVCLLAPHLTEANVDTLVAGAIHRTKAEIEAWLARQCAPATGSESGAATAVPRGRVRVIAARAATPTPESAPAESSAAAVDPLFAASSLPPGTVNVQIPSTPSVAPPAPAAYLVQIPIDEDTHALLREVQGLLGHSIRPDDVGAVFRRALDGLRIELLKRKAGATPRPRKAAPRATDGKRNRTIPAHVRRVVWTRDAGRCTFTSNSGRRCSATRALEYDHVVPFARGGATTIPGLRLRCRAHNQYEAERTFGPELMRRKRGQVRASAVRSPGGP